MAKAFSAEEAALLRNETENLLAGLKTARSLGEQQKAEIRSAAYAMGAPEILKILRTVPVEALNRGGAGFRIKTLEENGYRTAADVWTANVYNLQAIKGIGLNSAQALKREADRIAGETLMSIKVRLSSDDQSPEATRLVSAVCNYRRCRPVIDTCRRLESLNSAQTKAAMEQSLPALKTVGWIFLSRDKKQRAETACRFLKAQLESRQGQEALQALTDLEYAQKVTPQAAWADFAKFAPSYYRILEEIVPGFLGNEDKMYGLPEDIAREVQDECFFPDGLLCELRGYQEWGVKYILHQGNVLLGDEMGLGKTVQAIAAMVSLKNTGATHFLVVCPASVIVNWCKEIAKHSRLRSFKVHGNTKEAALASWIRTGGVAVTTYETTAAITLPEQLKISLMVVDEAHYIKNPETQRSKNVTRLAQQAGRKLFMTGTALENNVDEMLELLRKLNPDVAKKAQRLSFMASAEQFRTAVAPVYYRRKRDDVLTELPELIESEEWCTLSGEEQQAYEKAVISENYAATRRVSWNVDKVEDSSKAQRLKEIVEEAETEGRRVIVFSFFLDTLSKVCQMLGDRCLPPIYGAVTPLKRQQVIDEFNDSPAGSVLVCQIQAGGTGLNIQAASVVVICEPQLKPSVENQAISRSYRMGQTRNVLVFRLLCEDTIDERITELLGEKQEIFDTFADRSQAAEAQKDIEIDPKSLGDLIREEIERIKSRQEEQRENL